MTGKHPKTKPEDGPRSDITVDPGIGSSKGTTMSGEDPRNPNGGSTCAADEMNPTSREGAGDADKRGRTKN